MNNEITNEITIDMVDTALNDYLDARTKLHNAERSAGIRIKEFIATTDSDKNREKAERLAKEWGFIQ